MKEQEGGPLSRGLPATGVAFTLPSLLVIAAVFVAVVSALLALPVANSGGALNKPTSNAPVVQPRMQDEVRIELKSSGFDPSEVQHAAGTFAFAIENSTLSGEYTLRLKAEDGTVLKEVQVQKGSSAWTITLQAGNYTLTEAGNPQWLCRVTVQ